MPNAIITGASSGIGEALARVLAAEGYGLGLVARRADRLEAMRTDLPGPVWTRRIDVTEADAARRALDALLEEMGDVDLIVLNAGAGHTNPELDWETERLSIDVNVLGFAATANVAMRYFLRRGRGHLVGISSIAGLRGTRHAPAYHASKSFISTYLQALRHKAARSGLPIAVSDILPGWVDTAMAQGDLVFWKAPADMAARQIATAIRRRARRAYVTRRWRLVAWLLAVVPDWAFHRAV